MPSMFIVPTLFSRPFTYFRETCVGRKNLVWMPPPMTISISLMIKTFPFKCYVYIGIDLYALSSGGRRKITLKFDTRSTGDPLSIEVVHI